MSVKWTFHDPLATLADYTFAINPIGDSPVYQKNMTFQALVTPTALPLFFEGQDNPTTFSVTGTLLTLGQYEAMLNYYNLRHQFLCTDDTGRQRYIYLTEWQPVRVNNAIYPYKHTYTLSGYVLSETFPSLNDHNNPVIG